MSNRNETWEDEYVEITEEKKVPAMKGFDEESASKLQPLIAEFMSAYAEKGADNAEGSWLDEKLKSELPDKTDEEILSIREEIKKSVRSWDENMASINKACAEGQTKEEWFEGKLQESSVGVNVEDYGNYLALTNTGLHQENQELIEQIERPPADKTEIAETSENTEWNAANTHELAVQNRKGSGSK